MCPSAMIQVTLSFDLLRGLLEGRSKESSNRKVGKQLTTLVTTTVSCCLGNSCLAFVPISSLAAHVEATFQSVN
jgi:hypothetical protein